LLRQLCVLTGVHFASGRLVHISAVERAGLSTLNEGQNVEYELVTNRGKTSAENLRIS
jgi:cold shock CspA family protein